MVWVVKLILKCAYHPTSNIGVKEVASFGKTWGLNQSLRHLKEDNKARLIIEKALKKI
jgi:hypothetical protein